jgi:hypothetical protein
MTGRFVTDRTARAVALVAMLALGTAAQAQAPAERDVKRPDGSVIQPIQSAPPPPRTGYDPNSPGRVEQDNARRVRAEENQRRLEQQIKSRELPIDQTRRESAATGQAAADRAEQVERTKRARDAAYDSPGKRQ